MRVPTRKQVSTTIRRANLLVANLETPGVSRHRIATTEPP
jgi:hypothetical protein